MCEPNFGWCCNHGKIDWSAPGEQVAEQGFRRELTPEEIERFKAMPWPGFKSWRRDDAESEEAV